MTSPPVLTHVHTLGMSSDVLSPLHFVDENVVLYPAGHSVVIYNAEKKAQRFIFGSEGARITALAVSPNRRFVAIAESSDRAVITIYDVGTLRKRKVINSGQIMSYVWMAFSPDGKYLLTLGSAPDYLLTNWMWEKIRPLHSVRAASGAVADESQPSPSTATTSSPVMRQCSFCTADQSLVVVIGTAILCWYRVSSSGQLEPIAHDFPVAVHDFTSHVWLRDTLALGTQAGRLFLTRPGTTMFQQEINLGVSPDNGNVIHSLAAYARGLVVGSRLGTIFLVDITGLEASSAEIGALRRLTVTKSGTGASADVTCLALNPSEELLAVATSSSRAYFLSLTNSDMLRPEEMKFEPLIEPFHTGPIVGMDVCIRKPLVVTCGADSSIRVWNYLERQMECVKTFAEQCLSVAIHPAGFQIVAGFTDKLRLMNVLMDDIRLCKEFNVKNCREVQFASGGHMFAAVHGSLVVIYSTYTCELVATLRGHNQRVQSVQWSHDDSTVITSGSDGAIYEFQSRTGQREREYVQKGCKYFAAVGAQDARIYAVGNDRVLKEIADGAVQKELDSGAIMTQIVLSHAPERMLFTGSDFGVIRSFKFPLTGHCQDYQCHAGSVARIRLSHDDTLLFSAGMDGCLAMFEVREQEGRTQTTVAGAVLPWSDEVLVTRSDLDERTAMSNELKNKVDELTLHNEYQLRLQEMTHNERLKEVKETCQVALEEEKRVYDHVKDAKQDMEMEYEEQIKRIEELHAGTIALAKQEHQDAIMREVELYHELEREMKRAEDAASKRLGQEDDAHQDAMDERQIMLEEASERERERYQRLVEERDAIIREFNETKRQLEQDTDLEIMELKEKFDQTLAAERETTLRLKGENSIMKKRFSSLSNDIEDQKEEIKLMTEKEGQVRDQIARLRAEIEAKKSAITSLDATIGDKERTIYELKKRNQEMEKHKFVLDYQIKELKREIEPREMKIADMGEQEAQVDSQLESLHSQNGDLRAQVDSLNVQIADVQGKVSAARQRAQRSNAERRRQMYDLERAAHAASSEERVEIVRKYEKGGAGDDADGDDSGKRAVVSETLAEPQVAEEYKRQSEFLHQTIAQMKVDVARNYSRHRRESHQIVRENEELIREINALRKELTAKRAQMNANAISIKEQGGQAEIQQLQARRQANQAAIDQLRAQLATMKPSKT